MSATGNNLDLAGKAAGGRKLIAVVYADMVGYSRLIGLDDAGTLHRLRTLRRALIDSAVREHGGRIVQTGGDSLLVAFDSIDGAVRCAVKMQQQVPVYDGDQQADRRIRFRVGIDMGDAIPDGTDLHGDAVNIAARLEAASPVGGICVSRPVRDYVHGRLDLAFEHVGELTLKNITRPVEAYVLRLDPDASVQSTTPAADARRLKSRSRLRPVLAITVAVLLICGVVAIAWWFAGTTVTTVQKAPDPPPTVTASQAPPPSALAKAALPMDVGLAKAPRLSLVVLPFNNLGGEGVNEDAVDGITEDLTTDLSRWPDVLVIARNSAFTYKGKPIDIKRVGEELGVRYAVEGSVRKVDGTLRVTVQLISTETGTHLWAERFNVSRDGVGYGVDVIVQQIASTLNVRIVDAEAARSLRERPSNPEVVDILLRARSIYNRPPTPQRQAELIPLYERALELDPNSATALAGLAEALLDSYNSEDPTAPERLHRAEELLKRAELVRHDDPKVMWVRVLFLGQQNRCQEVIPAAQRAVAAHPFLTGPLQLIGNCLIRMGRAAEAIPELERAIRISPRVAYIGSRYRAMGYALLFLGRYDEAVVWFERSLAANPGDNARNRGNTRAAVAAAQALAGRAEEARLSAVAATGLWPTITVRSYFWNCNVTNSVLVDQVSRMGDGLRLAGVRDHAAEDADLGVPPDDVLHTNYEAPTPITGPGARTIRTLDLAALVEQRKPVVLDTTTCGRSLPGAVGLRGAGVGGSVSDKYQERLGRKMQQLTGADRNVPVVTMGWSAERFQGRNLALRLVALGYTEVYWYRGGTEAWEVAGLPETELAPQDW